MSNERKPTEILSEEHKNVLQKLDSLEGIISHLEKKEEILAKLKELVTFFAAEFWSHLDKEEQALFPELDKFIPRNGGPVAVMLVEHEDLRKTNKELQEAIDMYFIDPESQQLKRLIRGHGNHFISTLRGHIDKEDNILFKMADMHLDQGQNEKVVKLFEKIGKKGGS